VASVFKPAGSKRWHINYTDETGKRRKKVGCSDKAATNRLANDIANKVALRREGLIEPEAEQRSAAGRKPLAVHLAAWHDHLSAQGHTDKHAGMSLERARRVVALVKGAALAHIAPPRRTKQTDREAFVKRVDSLVEAARLADLTRDRVQGALAALKDGGLSLQSVNHHRACIRAFSRWAWRNGRTAADALAGLAGYNAATDRRHDRRTISIDELRRLVAAAHDGPTYQKMTGPARALCYRLAATTGLRYSEIASITPESLDLEADPATVTVAASATKNREPATLHLPVDLAADLAQFVATIAEGVPVFPLPRKGAKMLRVDLAASGVPFQDDAGLFFDFHSLRCECATLLDLAGVSPRVVQKKMRHSTLELTGRYTRPRVADLERATDALPSLRPAEPQPGTLAATGTDPAPNATPVATDSAEDSRNLLSVQGDEESGQWSCVPMLGLVISGIHGQDEDRQQEYAQCSSDHETTAPFSALSRLTKKRRSGSVQRSSSALR
jgi:integrase